MDIIDLTDRFGPQWQIWAERHIAPDGPGPARWCARNGQVIVALSAEELAAELERRQEQD
jgi:hypothetical protein